MPVDEGTPIGRYGLLQRVGLLSHTRSFVDEHNPYEFQGLWPMLKQCAKDAVSSISYDLGISLKIVANDQPFLRPVLRRIHRRLGES